VKNTFAPRSGRDGFVSDNVRRSFAYHAGVMVRAIDAEAVEVGHRRRRRQVIRSVIVPLWSEREDEGERE
jgi:hypothetical protein